jgi:hypothetical protein
MEYIHRIRPEYSDEVRARLVDLVLADAAG